MKGKNARALWNALASESATFRAILIALDAELEIKEKLPAKWNNNGMTEKETDAYEIAQKHNSMSERNAYKATQILNQWSGAIGNFNDQDD
jgi:hypothetical protein